ncbi:right-handed parallel beta-helix repeat-containing protein [Malonomonas rubra]|uniref:right-handed parallel beta-helix repeat-containing protein n=1 Tax=Malonomonas rubra TaxID=57040 RepID=UPI0026EE8DC1|nr:right-handed parallel beta-helix repeat-containing protein [Malonomonas rubra]
MLLRLLLLPLLLLPCTAQAALSYRGEISLYEDTVWEGEVLIDGILTVAMGVTLEIRPGTVIRFTRFDSNSDQIGEHEIFIQGRLLARGTAENPIIFTSAEKNPRVSDWGAVNMMMSDVEPNIIENCLFEYAYRGFHAHFSNAELHHSCFQFNQRGAQFQESDVLIDDCLFENNFNGLQFRDATVHLSDSTIRNNNWGVRAVYVELKMENNLISNNRVNGVSLRDSGFVLHNNQIINNRRGFYLQRSRGVADGNRIAGNLEHGIYLEDSLVDLSTNWITDNGRSGIKVNDAGGDVRDNRINGNHQMALVNDGEDDFALDVNWFAEPPVIIDQQLRPSVGRITVVAPNY